MTKLEEKLIELGYEVYEKYMLVYSFIKIFIKTHNDKWDLIIETDRDVTKAIMSCVDLDGQAIYTQQDIDDLQQAFNVMQQDLALLKELKNDK